MTGYFDDLRGELVSRSAALTGPQRERFFRTRRFRAAAGVVLTAGVIGGAAGIASSAGAPERVAVAPDAVLRAVPALAGKPVPIPAFVRKSLDNGDDKTVNGALARPLLAKGPDGLISWVAPTADGACLGVHDTIHSMGVVCATTAQIERGDLAIESYSGDPEHGPGIKVGVGGNPHASTQPDGSYVEALN